MSTSDNGKDEDSRFALYIMFYPKRVINFIKEMLGGQTGIGVPHIQWKTIESCPF